MSPSTRDELLELLEFEGSPTVSVYLPLHGHGREAEADRLRLRAALDRAGELLSGGHGEDVRASVLEGLDRLLDPDGIWGEQEGGLALFAGPGFRRAYRVPVAFPETVVVAPTFHTRPLVDYLASQHRFYVLELSRKRVQLWEGGPDALQPVPEASLPRNLVDALGFEYEREPEVVLRRKERTGAHGEHGRGGIMPVFHGHGVGMDDREPELETFFREVDDGLRTFLRGRKTPLFLATVEENEALYRSISELENLSGENIAANVRYWSPEELHRAAWPLAEREARKRADEALGLWETARGRGEAESDLAALARLAVAGRVRLLLTDRERRIRGTLDRETGAVELTAEEGAGRGAGEAELLDEIGELVILRGGDVLALPSARMPTRSGAAGILR